jgi:hypothetical protein
LPGSSCGTGLTASASGAHVLTKSRRYSTTMDALRKVQRDHVRRQVLGKNGIVLDA